MMLRTAVFLCIAMTVAGANDGAAASCAAQVGVVDAAEEATHDLMHAGTCNKCPNGFDVVGAATLNLGKTGCSQGADGTACTWFCKCQGCYTCTNDGKENVDIVAKIEGWSEKSVVDNTHTEISKWMDDRFKEVEKLSCKHPEEESALLRRKQLGEGDQTSDSRCTIPNLSAALGGCGKENCKPISQDSSRVERKANKWCKFATSNGLENVANSNTVKQLWEQIKISTPPSNQPSTIVVMSHSTIPSCKYLMLTFSATVYKLSYMMHLSRRPAAKRLGATAGNQTHGRKTQTGQQNHGRKLLRGRRRRRRRKQTSTLVFTGAETVPFHKSSSELFDIANFVLCQKEPYLKKALNELRFKFLKELL